MSGTTKSLLRTMSLLMRYDREMSIVRLQMLLLIALDRKGEGVLVRDLMKRTGLNQSSVARNLALLGAKTARGQAAPLMWVEQVPDHEDPRRVRVKLTPKGQQVLSEIEELAD